MAKGVSVAAIDWEAEAEALYWLLLPELTAAASLGGTAALLQLGSAPSFDWYNITSAIGAWVERHWRAAAGRIMAAHPTGVESAYGEVQAFVRLAYEDGFVEVADSLGYDAMIAPDPEKQTATPVPQEVEIGEGDIDAAIADWDAKMGEFAGLLDAEVENKQPRKGKRKDAR